MEGRLVKTLLAGALSDTVISSVFSVSGKPANRSLRGRRKNSASAKLTNSESEAIGEGPVRLGTCRERVRRC